VEKEMQKNFGNGHLFLSKKMSSEKVMNNGKIKKSIQTIMLTNYIWNNWMTA
jgi:hypothetical protein